MSFGKDGEEKVKTRIENAIVNDPKWNKITEHSEAMVMWHCFLKGLQGGPVLGTVVALPYYAITRRPFAKIYFKALRHGTMGFTTFALTLGAYKVQTAHELFNKDRRYRIYYSQGQNRVDYLTMAAGGMACGITGVFCLLTARANVGVTMVNAWSLGILGGLGYYNLTK